MKFLHTADLHLGRAFTNLPLEKARQRREDLKEALRRVVQTANERRVDALLIAGDLFEHCRPLEPLVDFVAHTLGQVSAPVVITPGNHDAATSGSPYLDNSAGSFGRFPPNVHIIREPRWTAVNLNLPLPIYGIAYDADSPHRNVIRELREVLKPDPPALAVAHATHSLAEFESQSERYFPFSSEDLKDLPLAYLALGHWHRHWNEGCAHYCGTPEPLSERDGLQPNRGVLIVNINDAGVVESVETIDLSRRRYRSLSLEVSQFANETALLEHVRQEADENCLLSVNVGGVCGFAWTRTEEDFEEELRECFFAIAVRLNLAAPKIEAQSNTVKAEFLQILRQEIASATDDRNREILNRAMRYGALALDGELA